MYKKHCGEEYIFMLRPFWSEMDISMEIVTQRYQTYFGDIDRVIDDREEAIQFVSPIVSQLQEKLTHWMKNNSPTFVVKCLLNIFNQCFNLYMSQRAVREKMVDMNISDGDTADLLGSNRNIALDIINSTNLWLENSLLFQNEIKEHYCGKTSTIEVELCIDLYMEPHQERYLY